MTFARRAMSMLVSSLLILIITGNVFALSWTDRLPETAPVDVYYDFRPTILGQPNWITPWQAGEAVSAFDLWDSVSNLNFIRHPWAPEHQIINIGVSPIDGQWGIIGQGGYNYTNAGGVWHIQGGLVDMDAHENWDLMIGNGNPPGTIDFFTVAAHEIGHALGLNHSENPADVMYPYYTGEKIWASAADVASVQWLYGGQGPRSGTSEFSTLTAVPEPSTLLLFSMGLIMFGWVTRRRRQAG